MRSFGISVPHEDVSRFMVHAGYASNKPWATAYIRISWPLNLQDTSDCWYSELGRNDTPFGAVEHILVRWEIATTDSEFIQTSIGHGVECLRDDQATIHNNVIDATLRWPGTCFHGDTVIYTKNFLGELIEGLDQFESPHFEDTVGSKISPGLSGIRCQIVFQKDSGDRVH